MADYRLCGYTTQVSLYIPASDYLGRTFSQSTTTPFNADQWNRIRVGGANTPTVTADSAMVSVYRSDSDPNFYARRLFLQFPIPGNISRLDNTPQLFLNCSSITGTPRVVPTSVDHSDIEVPWDSTDPVEAIQSVQTGAGAKYIDDAYVTIVSGRNVITLNEVAKAHALMLGKINNNVRNLTVAVIDYTYDWTGNLPADGVFNHTFYDSHGDSLPPQLILRKPWFVNDRGDEFPVDYDYTIRAFDVGVNQKDRSVPQLPFSTAIKGPMSLRGKNIPYNVTT